MKIQPVLKVRIDFAIPCDLANPESVAKATQNAQAIEQSLKAKGGLDVTIQSKFGQIRVADEPKDPASIPAEKQEVAQTSANPIDRDPATILAAR